MKGKRMIMDKKITTFTLEEHVKRSFNYLDRMVDKDHLPYFNVFLTDPCQAAHDWPDFGDVTARQYQAAVMARRMTGITSANEKIWLEKLLGYIAEDGLLHRPVLDFSGYETDMGEGALVLYALATAYADAPDARLESAIKKMVDGLYDRKDALRGGNIGDGFVLIDLMAVVRILGYRPALELASVIVDHVLNIQELFTPENRFKGQAHMHGNLRTLIGIALYAAYTDDNALLDMTNAIYRYVRDETGTRFGFIPEEAWREDDIVMCETCALMDYIGLMAVLARRGHEEYFDDMERLVRNHLVESQLADSSWLKSDKKKPDTEQFTYNDVGGRMTGAFAGWSSPNHFLAAKENLFWGGPELRGKTRLFQNCCGGSGTHAYYIAWKNSAFIENGFLNINMHIDKLLPEAEIRCYQPFTGLLTVRMTRSCPVRSRIPSFTCAEDVRTTINGKPVKTKTQKNYLLISGAAAGDMIEIRYPLPMYSETVAVGNPGHKKYGYDVLWKGDTVIRMTPYKSNPVTAYSYREACSVEVFYNTAGPGLLYDREYMLEDQSPELSEIYEDVSPIDFWRK
jgi:hypothetical protein